MKTVVRKLGSALLILIVAVLSLPIIAMGSLAFLAGGTVGISQVLYAMGRYTGKEAVLRSATKGPTVESTDS